MTLAAVSDDVLALELAERALAVADRALERRDAERALLGLRVRAGFQAAREAWETVDSTNRALGIALRRYENTLAKIPRPSPT